MVIEFPFLCPLNLAAVLNVNMWSIGSTPASGSRFGCTTGHDVYVTVAVDLTTRCNNPCNIRCIIVDVATVS